MSAASTPQSDKRSPKRAVKLLVLFLNVLFYPLVAVSVSSMVVEGISLVIAANLPEWVASMTIVSTALMALIGGWLGQLEVEDCQAGFEEMADRAVQAIEQPPQALQSSTGHQVGNGVVAGHVALPVDVERMRTVFRDVIRELTVEHNRQIEMLRRAGTKSAVYSVIAGMLLGIIGNIIVNLWMT